GAVRRFLLEHHSFSPGLVEKALAGLQKVVALHHPRDGADTEKQADALMLNIVRVPAVAIPHGMTKLFLDQLAKALDKIAKVHL
nr:hypothetical protein [Candidatus Sigynarchaeota archaeon]